MSRAGRVLPSLAGLAGLLAFAVLYRMAPETYQAILQLVGVVPGREPFLDASYVLSAAQCRDAGIDVYVANPCDAMRLSYDYSPFLLDLLPRGTTTALAPAVAVTAAILFFLSLAALPPPQRPRDRALVLFCTLSTMTAYGVERANIDLAIFPLLVVAGALATRETGARCLGYGLTLFAALLKFYPAAALLPAVRERPRTTLAVAAAVAAVLVAFVALCHVDLLRSLANRPVGFSFTDAFAAANLPQGFAEIASPAADRYPVLAPVLAATPAVLLALLILRAASQGLSLARRSLVAALPALPPAERTYLAIGAAVVAGCFLTGLNFYYRGIFLLLTLPGLLALGRAEGGSRLVLRTAQAILFLMWSECFRQAIVHFLPALGLSQAGMNEVLAFFWLARELVWWRVVGVFLGVVLAFAATAEAWRWLHLPALRPRAVDAAVDAG